MKNYFKKLKKEGFYILIRKGEFNNKIFNEYQLTKNNPTKDSRLIACYMNKLAVKKLVENIGFKIVDNRNENIVFHGSCPEALKFETQTKEPLIRW